MLLRRLLSTTVGDVFKIRDIKLLPVIHQNQVSNCVDACDSLTSLHLDHMESANLEEDIEVLPKTISTKQEYQLQSDISIAKSDGCAPLGKAFNALFQYLKERNGQEKSLSNTHVTLFNFHKTDFAEKLLQKNVGKVIIAEAAMHHARDSKKFVHEKRKEKEVANVEAVRADQAVLFGLGKKRSGKAHQKLLANLECGNFGLKTVNIEEIEHAPLAWCVTAPVLIATFPIPTQQAAVLTVLRKSLLTHLCKLNPQEETIYNFGAVELITFLSAGNFAHLLCASDPLLNFFSHNHLRQSGLMHKLFDISPLSSQLSPLIRNFKEFKPSQFDPKIPPAKPIAHEKKLKEVNIHNGRVYAVSIRPKRAIDIAHCYVGSDELTSADLLKYTWWNYSIGRFATGRKVKDVIGSICPEAEQFLGSFERIGTVTTEALDSTFLKVRHHIRVPDEWIDKEVLLKI